VLRGGQVVGRGKGEPRHGSQGVPHGPHLAGQAACGPHGVLTQSPCFPPAMWAWRGMHVADPGGSAGASGPLQVLLMREAEKEWRAGAQEEAGSECTVTPPSPHPFHTCS
jgi:hypothetical protein